MSPEDNINDIYHNLKYEADILFTRWHVSKNQVLQLYYIMLTYN